MLRFLSENLALKIISLAFALVLWIFVMGERRHEVSHIIPVTYKGVPEGLIIANQVPGSVEVVVSGPRALLSHLSASEMAIAVDLAGAEAGVTSFKRLEESLRLPSGLAVLRISPAYVDVKLERVREKQVPVRLVLSGEPAAGYRVRRVRVIPSRVTLSGAESELRAVSEVLTEGVDLAGVRESFVQTVALSHSRPFTMLKDQRSVEVQVAIDPDPTMRPAGAPSQAKPKGSR
jgi:YbbR domain-containing protein